MKIVDVERFFLSVEFKHNGCLQPELVTTQTLNHNRLEFMNTSMKSTLSFVSCVVVGL